MDVRKSLSLLALALFTIVAFYSSGTEACTCMPSHPQTHFCKADYVVLIRVLRQSRSLVSKKVVYKVEVKRSYKMNEKGHNTLKHGRITTSDSETTCGVSLEINKLYMIAVRGSFDSCNYIKEYKNMTMIERRGFTGVYRKGCNCEVRTCFGNQCLRQRESTKACKWSPYAKCETDYSACMVSSYRTPEGPITKCHWRRTPAYKACMKDP